MESSIITQYDRLFSDLFVCSTVSSLIPTHARYNGIATRFGFLPTGIGNAYLFLMPFNDNSISHMLSLFLMSQLVISPHSHLIPPLLSYANLSRHVTAAYWAGPLRKISRTRSPRTDGKQHTARLLSRSRYSHDLFPRRERCRRHL